MRFALPVCLGALLVTAACGSSTPASTSATLSPTPVPTPTPTPSPGIVPSCAGGSGATGTMSAQINGVSWVAACIATSRNGNASVSFGASDNATNATNAQTIAMAAPAAPGTYPINSAAVNGTNGLLLIGAQLWTANVIGGSGTVTINTLTAAAVSGTFSFSLVPQAPATGTKTITNGVFNITF
jgi:hypothetical protein